MKLWVTSVLLLIMICLTIPFVTADKKIGTGTPASVEFKSDPLIGLKKVIGMETSSTVDVMIDGKRVANIPDNSPLVDVPVTEECLNQHPYGSIHWHDCEVGG